MSRFTGQSIDDGADLWGYAANNWNFQDAAQGLFITLRGHVGEELAANHFEEAGMTVTWPGRSNEPGFDFSVDGHDVQVKVVQDGGRAAAKHFETTPDIPIIMNADAQNIPADAIPFDPVDGIDPALLVGDRLVLVDQSLTLDSATAELAQVFPTVDAGDLVTDLANPAAGTGVLITVIQSGIREGRLLREGHTDAKRAIKNVTIDTAGKGTGFAVGAKAGAIAGAYVDVGTAGATLGLGAVIGGAIGGIAGAFGGKRVAEGIRLRPLLARGKDHRDALEQYSDELTRAQDAVNTELRTTDTNVRSRLETRAHVNRRAMERHIENARRELASARQVDTGGIVDAVIEDTRTRARSLDPRIAREARAPKAFRRAAAKNAAEQWGEQARLVGQHATRSPGDLASFWDHMCATPAGAAAMQKYIHTVGVARDQELRASIALGATLASETRAFRQSLREEFDTVRATRMEQARHQLEPHTRQLADAADWYRAELAAAGADLSKM